MAEHIPEPLQKKLSDRLAFYEDLGIRLFYRDRGTADAPGIEQGFETSGAASRSNVIPQEEPTLPNPARKPELPKAAHVVPPAASKATSLPLPAAGPSLFEAVNKIANDTLPRVREDLGECTRCKLHKGRNKIVFGDGNPKAELVFVGEGPGADEDAQGLPFVGRAGKLLTQMIEAMGLQRKDVYICNVVKCRPPENRTPQPDEMEVCGQFLARQLAVIRPKAICALGSTAAKALLGTKDGVMKLRGNWTKWRDIPLMVTYHPSYLLRPYNQNAKREAWEDLKKVLHYVYD